MSRVGKLPIPVPQGVTVQYERPYIRVKGPKGELQRKMEEEIQVTGRIYVMGNEPFTQLGIESDDGKVYALIGEQDKDLRGLQGKRLTVKGKFAGKTNRGAEAIRVSSFGAAESK